MRLLIGESGATKTEWAWIRNGKPLFLTSSGLHPAWFDPGKVTAELKRILGGIDPVRILFYGAGCYSEDAARPVRELLEQLFRGVPVQIHDDLEAVAHAFLGRDEGVAGILGTGSNSGLFRGGTLLRNVPALGYILGDEGSAADIGKRILRRVLRKESGPEAETYLRSRLGEMEYSEVIREFYGAERPSYFLARIAKDVLEGEYPKEIRSLIEESFHSFVEAHLKKYEGFPQIRVVLSGGVAVHHQDVLRDVLQRHGVEDATVSGGLISALARRCILNFEQGEP